MLRVLIVDDNVTNLDLTSRMLVRAGYGVDTAGDGEEGVKMALQWRYDLIVMDMSMPGIGGGEATRRIRSAERTLNRRRVPVIAFTANNVEEFRRRAMRSDMDDFITKPIERRQLLAAIERSIDTRLTVLVADDCVADREQTLRYLRTLHHMALIGARNGAEAVDACSHQRVDFALINLSLPDISGIEAAWQVQHSKHGEGIGIIAVSDTADPEARKHSIRHGCVGFLEKPLTQAAVLELIQPVSVNA